METFASISITKMENCSLSNANHWHVYQAQFYLVSFLTVHILQSDDSEFQLDDFLDNLLTMTYGLDYQYILTVKIRHSILTEKKDSLRTLPPTPTGNLDSLDLYSKIDRAEFLKKKRLLSDSVQGHLIIAWNVDIVHQFLDQDYKNVIPEPRATYAFMFFGAECELAKFHSLLKRLWVEYNVANVIAHTPCSCDNTQIHMFRPFVKTEDSWGLTSVHSLQEIRNHFRLMTNPLVNFNRFPLNVTLFPRVPTLLVAQPKLLQYDPMYRNMSWSKNFTGLDGLILGALAEYFNFDINVLSTMIDSDYGVMLPNGTATSSLGDIVHRRAHFHANGRFLAYFHLKEIEFTLPYIKDEICVVVPKAPKIPRWELLFTSMDFQTWFCITLTCIVCVIFWFNIGPSSSLEEVFYHVYSYLVGIPIRSVTRSTSRVFFIVPCMVFSVVVLGMVQGFFFKSLTIPHYYDDINTIQEVLDSGMPVASFIWYLFKNDSELIKRFKPQMVDAPDNVFDLVAFQKRMFAVDVRSRLDLEIKSKYVDDDGTPLLHIVNECLTSFLTANIVPSGSPFLPVFNDIIGKLFESGLMQKWYRDIFQSLVTEKMLHLQGGRRRTIALSLGDTQGAFYVIVAGYMFSGFALVCEIMYKQKVDKR